MEQSTRIKIVLVEPTHPGNIGSVARAMKTMGLSRLVLVNPKKFPHYEASKLAAGAESVLDQAEVVTSLSAAISDCTLVLGTSVRDREVSWPTRDPRAAAESIIQHVASPTHQAAILFGRESSGLSNAELDQCQFQIRIPANPEYSSLNLASAVQLINYEIRMQAINQSTGLDDQAEPAATSMAARQRPATKAEREGFLEHLQNTLVALDFVKVNPPTVLMRKLTRLYNKADLTVEEIQILRGILASVDQKLTPS
ncbi:tRNA (cytidine/uridine-2'-O-)-methyltransferase TrmJ [Arenicella chitinivorans]|uniref:tRNA (cytidine/uridine-2'-O-)-methyltransferase TrmJ n=1 Tax=Arenicella chitinivorans TaxID=1329800 RepID=A0A918VN31_9GAMM|nr:RNA methyltransferase [Arenicella chitinivorans]GHA09144.1 tRNA (cytidine/uridine-2'-O-)-methyltransferase TrmJ [Arenicella chitinivorans]